MEPSPSPIITASGKLTKEIYHIDIQAYAVKKLISTFVLETPEAVAIIDTGTSDDVYRLLRFMKKLGISSKEKIKYLVPSHYHFDHFGGGWKLWEMLKAENPAIKVLTTRKTHDRLQNPAVHVQHARRTFGEFVGEMRPLPEEAYEIVDPDTPLPIPGLERGKSFQLVSTPGHTDDHCCPTLLENDGHASFVFCAEAAGTLFNSTKLVTFGTSMPPEYSTTTYLRSLQKIIDLKPDAVGYCHFGAVKGKDAVMQVLTENLEFTTFFKDYVKRKFEEGGGVRHVVEDFLKEIAPSRTDKLPTDMLVNIIVALVYGQLVDLGLKEGW
ncbi:MAG: MBL fold metallo-hydrolase [Candidatus Sigynarchaeota archaeon]